jgi:hypothetical protein
MVVHCLERGAEERTFGGEHLVEVHLVPVHRRESQREYIGLTDYVVEDALMLGGDLGQPLRVVGVRAPYRVAVGRHRHEAEHGRDRPGVEKRQARSAEAGGGQVDRSLGRDDAVGVDERGRLSVHDRPPTWRLQP